MKSNKERKKELSRRDFIKTTAVGVGAAAFAGLGAKEAKAQDLAVNWDKEADVVVLGAGGAGMAAAIEAHDAGADVVVLEKASAAGGSTAICGGIMYAAGTSLQAAAGITDTPDEMYKFWLACGEDQNDPDLVRLVAEKSAENFEWVTSLGNKWLSAPYVSGGEAMPEYAAITPPKARGHRTNGGGAALFKVLADAAAARGIQTFLETTATELVANPNRNNEVLGVKATRKGWTVYILAKRGVVIATGGFPDSKEMLRAYSPEEGYRGASKGVPGLTGDGIKMGQALGADLMGMTEIVAAPSIRLPGAPGISRSIPMIFVNERGRRFYNETVHYDCVTHIMSKQRKVFAIFDQEQKAKGGRTICSAFSDDLAKEISDGLIITAPTLAELAAKLGMDATKLEDTVNEWNLCTVRQADPEFGRASAFGYIKTRPFYAVEVVAGMYDTTGGMRINTKAQVKNVFGGIIPRLYTASPGAIGGVIGAIYPGSGSAIQVCICFGRIAGKNAAAERPWS